MNMSRCQATGTTPGWSGTCSSCSSNMWVLLGSITGSTTCSKQQTIMQLSARGVARMCCCVVGAWGLVDYVTTCRTDSTA